MRQMYKKCSTLYTARQQRAQDKSPLYPSTSSGYNELFVEPVETNNLGNI